ncbi:MAG TPA: translation initiation factor IF-3 [Bacteroidetes bacterium]|nr:translation initiation factor IF-3 [Bacteroidota bacterium]
MRINEQVNAPKVRLIGPEGKQVGLVSLKEAMDMAENLGLDLVEIAPDAKPPVCKILDFGKYRYEITKKEKDQRKRQHVIHVKEIRLRPKTEEHDLAHKIKHAKRFLEEGNRLKATVLFRGRELVYKKFGYDLINRVVQQLSDVAKVEKGPIEEGRNLVIFFVKK